MDTQHVQDWIALCNAKAQYCRLLDTKKWQAWSDLWTDDFVLDTDGAGNIPLVKGKQAALAQVRSSIEYAKTCHHVHNPEIDIQGNEASVIWAMQDRVVWGDGKPSLTGFGHYHELWLKIDGVWKLQKLKLTRLHLDVTAPLE
ncbi:nuclear transport factor 2 family protein [Halioxenophilus aromaticivorans]|uniref:Nuclear transport factor 2 family protein n=1 Tax=Halioxenophilus aromaticivorans TaxID=1306992 RepID=A0AAV3U3F7_9ALTE